MTELISLDRLPENLTLNNQIPGQRYYWVRPLKGLRKTSGIDEQEFCEIQGNFDSIINETDFKFFDVVEMCKDPMGVKPQVKRYLEKIFHSGNIVNIKPVSSFEQDNQDKSIQDGVEMKIINSNILSSPAPLTILEREKNIFFYSLGS